MSLPKNTAATGVMFMITQGGVPNPYAASSLTAKISKDGGAFATCSNAPYEVGGLGAGNGWYAIDLTAAELNCNNCVVSFSSASYDRSDIHLVTT